MDIGRMSSLRAGVLPEKDLVPLFVQAVRVLLRRSENV